MEARGGQRIESGIKVYDRDNHQLGAVAPLPEVDAPTAPDAAGDPAAPPALPGRGPPGGGRRPGPTRR
jgi:hypothetical protein